MSKHVSQIRLVTAVMGSLVEQGFPDANERQMAAIIEAADMVVAAFNAPHAPAVPASGLAAWLASDDTGLSSRTLARHLAPLAGISVTVPGGRGRRPADTHPLDPADFGRCVRLFEAVPELRPLLPAMAGVSPTWARMVAEWDRWEALYREELPSGRAPKLYAEMTRVRDETETS